MEGGIMADLRASGLGGVPKGETADRPSSPSIGDVFNNGTLGVEEIYTSAGWVTKNASPASPIMGTATNTGTNVTYNNGTATVSFTPGSGSGGLAGSYTITSSPGGLTSTGSSSPITITGLTPGTSYTFSLSATNGFGTANAAFTSNAITATTLPQAPTIGTATATGTSGQVSLTFTAGQTGGATITNYEYSTDGTTYTAFSPAQTSSPLTINGLTNGQSQTLRIRAVNSNGASVASSASNSVTPVAPKASGGTITYSNNRFYHTFTSNGTFTPTSSFSTDAFAVGGGGGGGNGQSGGNGSSTIGNAGTVTIGGLTVNGFAGGAYNDYNGSTDGNMAGHGGAGARQNGYKSVGNYGVSTNSSTWFPGAGGNGFQWTTALNGNNNYYAGGGAGGHASGSNGAAGGLGGGGNSGSTGVTYGNGDSRYNGTSNTGGGGSGNPHTTGGQGGSGVVIVSYAA